MTKSHHSADSRLVNSQIASQGGLVIFFTASSRRGQPALEAVGHCGKGTVRLAQRRDTRGPQRIELSTAATSLRSGLTDPRFQKTLVLEPIECGVDGVDRY